MNSTKNNEYNNLTDMEFVLGQMYTDSVTLGVEAFLTDALRHVTERCEDFEAAGIIEKALGEFLDNPCEHLNSFEHLRAFVVVA